MGHKHFPEVGAPLQLKSKSGIVTTAIVMRSEPKRGFVIVLNDDFETVKLRLQPVAA